MEIPLRKTSFMRRRSGNCLSESEFSRSPNKVKFFRNFHTALIFAFGSFPLYQDKGKEEKNTILFLIFRLHERKESINLRKRKSFLNSSFYFCRRSYHYRIFFCIRIPHINIRITILH